MQRLFWVAALSATSSSLAIADGISGNAILQHIKVLASDEFEGRAPGSAGEEKTMKYIVDQFKQIGLQPGNPDGSFLQAVPLVGIRSTPTLQLSGCAESLKLASPDEYVAWTTRVTPTVTINASDLVFVGYGVQAPEYGWDDYKDVDVKGKTLLMLINDPAIPDPKNPEQLDPAMFKGKAMTYYGRWTYKYEIAAAKGAAGAIIIHETKPAAYPYDVVRNNGLNENMTLKASDGNVNEVAMRSWIREDKARALLQSCELDFDQLKAKALRKDFRPVVLGAKASAQINNQLREVNSYNFVARLEGKDKKKRHEQIVYTAHWDHLGVTEENGKRQVFNGAVDNATGIGVLLEIAREFKRHHASLKRSVMFMAVTAEEKGLLGSQYYADNPLYPLKDTLANFNMDALQPWGKARDVQVIGFGQTTFDAMVSDEAKKQGRTVMPDDRPENGYYFRSDHFNFAKKGVPAMYLKGGIDVIGKEPGYGLARGKEFTSEHYHKDGDEVRADWDMGGLVQDGELYFNVGRKLVRDLQDVQFVESSEFRAAELARKK